MYAEPCQKSKMKRFVKIFNTWDPINIFTKHSIFGVLQGSTYVSVYYTLCNIQKSKSNKVNKPVGALQTAKLLPKSLATILMDMDL